MRKMSEMPYHIGLQVKIYPSDLQKLVACFVFHINNSPFLFLMKPPRPCGAWLL